jgi:hypothetical protein
MEKKMKRKKKKSIIRKRLLVLLFLELNENPRTFEFLRSLHEDVRVAANVLHLQTSPLGPLEHTSPTPATMKSPSMGRLLEEKCKRVKKARKKKQKKKKNLVG